MRTIAYNQILQTVEHLCIASAYDLPADVLAAIRTAAQTEPDPRARRILDQLIENARIAARDRIPICQDTGLAVVFIDQGADVVVAHPDNRPDATLYDAVNEGVAAGYEKGLLRKSVVAEPLHERPNTQTNTPAVIHHRIVPGDRLHITIMSKGGGCENKSQFKMFNPTESADAVCNWIADVVTQAGASACPPFVVGVGLGGNFELACLLSKRALLRPIAEPHPDPFYADLERRLLEWINASNLGPQGLGGRTTALAVKIETAPCHIASLPAAVNIECHAHRHKSATL
ncbi:MAG TPA: fumarate hydratase [Anaerohalosphaeraceae bacterium]|jgi:fumarate hydratase subunit alpha|nr:fumarate hydratase [Anaerohalosphaeraceae bacterium]HRT48902.1 fumarate hydratase [Anaerohalosphaeraceae bacterium]HRT85025.1 fumarate hydratase [Anaerohalosphaeraceae bacterium]